MLGYCQSAASATIVEMARIQAHTTLLLVCHGSYGPTINSRLLADHTNYTHPGVMDHAEYTTNESERCKFAIKLTRFLFLLAAEVDYTTVTDSTTANTTTGMITYAKTNKLFGVAVEYRS